MCEILIWELRTGGLRGPVRGVCDRRNRTPKVFSPYTENQEKGVFGIFPNSVCVIMEISLIIGPYNNN